MGGARTTTLVILGTDHSPQLVAESYQPAVFRAFFGRVRPDAVCIEHPPEDFARGDYRYGAYAYEKHRITLPWARERGAPVYPVDWIPDADDQRLAWGVPDIEESSFLRTESYVRSFVSFGEGMPARELFFAEVEESRRPIDEWYDQPRQAGERDFPRRVGLYRTYMQAMRIKAVARQHPGGTVLVVIGYYHKADIERVLGDSPDIEIAQPSAYGHPTPDEIAAELRRDDLLAVLAFNLLGVQSRDGPVDRDWMRRCLARVEAERRDAETSLLGTRLAALTEELHPEDAILRYREILASAGEGPRFSFDGVEDRRRIDSYYDPFGNLSVGQRALLELAREEHKLGRRAEAREAWRELSDASGLSAFQRAQLEAYRDEYVSRMA